jgi:hypothetical protein
VTAGLLPEWCAWPLAAALAGWVLYLWLRGRRGE